MINRYRNLSLPQLARLAGRLGRCYRDSHKVIGLIGPLGAGKTTFVKHFAKGVGMSRIKSPTFTIINQYSGSGRRLYHLDLYRMAPSELIMPGITDLLRSSDGLIIIEWLDRAPRLKKFADLIINLQPAQASAHRHVTIWQK